MKIVLVCLMCVALTMSQALAISGGPVYGGKGKVDTTGTYAGVLFPTSHVNIDSACQNEASGLNQIGLYSLAIAKTGLGTGPALLFNQGQIYTGTIQASADPKTAKVTGIFSASFPYIISVPSGTDSMGHATFTTTTVIAQASGKLNAKIKADQTQTGTAAARMKGTADVQFELTVNCPFDEIIFTVSGFKQASL